MNRIFVTPIKLESLLIKVIERFSLGYIIVFEQSQINKSIIQLNDQKLKLKTQFNDAYRKKLSIVKTKINLKNIEDIKNILSNNPRGNLCGLTILDENENFIFLVGDNFHPECISFLKNDENNAFIQNLKNIGVIK